MLKGSQGRLAGIELDVGVYTKCRDLTIFVRGGQKGRSWFLDTGIRALELVGLKVQDSCTYAPKGLLQWRGVEQAYRQTVDPRDYRTVEPYGSQGRKPS